MYNVISSPWLLVDSSKYRITLLQNAHRTDWKRSTKLAPLSRYARTQHQHQGDKEITTGFASCGRGSQVAVVQFLGFLEGLRIVNWVDWNVGSAVCDQFKWGHLVGPQTCAFHGL